MSKYKVLADQLKNQILCGTWQDGMQLETESDMMKRYQLSRHTVRQAISILESEGYVRRRQGSGTFVSGTKQHTYSQKNNNRTIGVVCTYLSEYIFPFIIKGIESVLTENEYPLSLMATKNQINTENLLLRTYSDRPTISGLIIEGSRTALPNPSINLYQGLKEAGIPMVFFHAKYHEFPDSISISVDDKAGGKKAVQYLYNKGHRNIAGIFISTDWQGHMRYAGYLEGFAECGIPFNDKVLWFQNKEQFEYLMDGSSSYLLSFFEGTTAVVCYNDQIAIILINELKKRGFSLPDDLSIISFDDSVYASLADPPLTSFSHPKEALGKKAAEKIINIIHGVPETSSTMSWTLIERNSVRSL